MRPPVLCLSLLTTTLLSAGEVAIEPRPFVIETRVDARVMPAGEVTLLRLPAKAWTGFTIEQLTAHGTRVDKGQPLLRCDTKGIDRRIAELERAVATAGIEVTMAATALEQLRESAPHRLEAARRAAAVAGEELDYFTTTRRMAEEEAAAQQLARSRQQLDNESEELRQLQQMYQADDLTEDTEEIILTRQKYYVRSAEFGLRMEQLKHDRKRGVLLPREARQLADAGRDADLALKLAEQQVPREIALKAAELEALEAKLAEDRETLAELREDRGLFEITAPADGLFYHGTIADGRWTTGDLLRSLEVGGQPPRHKAFATFIPQGTALEMVAFVQAADARRLTDRASGTALLAGSEDREIPVRVATCSTLPETDGRHRVRFTPTWPDGTAAAIGNPAEVRVITHHNPKAITVPENALHFGPDGWTVELMLADGKTGPRGVTRGLQADGQVEILGGLEPGQVIVTPDK